MNKPKCVKAILCCIILAFGIWFSLADFQLVLGAEAVGRENPFADIQRPHSAVPVYLLPGYKAPVPDCLSKYPSG